MIEYSTGKLLPHEPFLDGSYPREARPFNGEITSLPLFQESIKSRLQEINDSKSLEESYKLQERLQIERYQVHIEGENLPRIMKDPCFIVKDDGVFVLGTQGDNDIANLGVLTARGDSLTHLQYMGALQPQFLEEADRSDFCAAGGIYDPEERKIIAAVQTLCFKPDGQIELISTPDGRESTHHKTLFYGTPDTHASVIYDPHLFRWNEKWMMTLNQGPRIGESSVYVAESKGSWNDDWFVHENPVLTSADCPVQSKNNPEWNKEGTNIIQLDTDLAMMVAVGFVEPNKFGSTHQFGTQQRITLHASHSPLDRFSSLSLPLLDPRLERNNQYVTEVGHPAFVTNDQGRIYEEDGKVFISYQGRNTIDFQWRYFMASLNKDRLQELGYELTSQEKVIFQNYAAD